MVKLTNAVVEDKKTLPDGVDIDYEFYQVDGNTVPRTGYNDIGYKQYLSYPHKERI